VRPVNHLSDDELVLHYYGENGSHVVAAERHLRTCPRCARAYETLARSLNAVTPPVFVEPDDDLTTLRQVLSDRFRERSSPFGLVALVWLVALVYPLSLQAIVNSARWSQSHLIGVPLVPLAVIWACAGPLLAAFALNRMAADRFEALSTRLLVVGALMAATSPGAFLLVSRVNVSLSLNFGVWSWYCVLALASLAALFRWRVASHSTPRFLYLHRLSALFLTVFVLGHIINQSLAFISLPAYAAMRSVMRLVSQQPVSYALTVAAVAIQIVSGAAMGMKRVGDGAAARNLQAVSGWYLAVFLLVHVLSGLLFSQPQTTTTATTAALTVNQINLLASARAAAQLPFLLLGVAAFLFHVGVYARLVALAYLAETSVRRLSYAGVFVATTVIVTVGLSLCGIHLIR
jgi:succinate dehydrogenase/fumarate reductase cytochrome b subunit